MTPADRATLLDAADTIDEYVALFRRTYKHVDGGQLGEYQAYSNDLIRTAKCLRKIATERDRG